MNRMPAHARTSGTVRVEYRQSDVSQQDSDCSRGVSFTRRADRRCAQGEVPIVLDDLQPVERKQVHWIQEFPR